MINAIVAVEKGQGIGFNGSMPWPRLSGDLRFFKDKTINNIVIMGRKTWDSIGGKPLPNRINILLTRNTEDLGADHQLIDTDVALDICDSKYPDKEIFIIGGSAIYQHYLDIVDRFYVTEIDEDFECDTFFDMNYVQKNFTKVIEHATFSDPIKYTIKEYNL